MDYLACVSFVLGLFCVEKLKEGGKEEGNVGKRQMIKEMISLS